MIPAHPLAEIFPMLDTAASADLAADIAAHGLREPVVLHEGAVLDGRNRLAALVSILERGGEVAGEPIEAADLDGSARSPFLVPFAGDDPLAFVLSRNLHRRHLNESQRALVAARIAAVRRGESGGPRANLRARDEAAEALRVSPRSVTAAGVALAHGAPELVAAVERGDVPVSAADTLARLDVDDQVRLIRETADPRALSRVARELRAERQLEKRNRREARETALGARIAALPDRRYGVIIADPEWRYEVWSEATGRDRAPDNHYPTSPLDAIKARPVAGLAADDCVLFLWTTSPMLTAGLDVLAAWGFRYVTNLVWHKLRPGAARGTGYWFTGEHELVLVGTRGNPPIPAPGDQVRSLFPAPVGEHSAKPSTIHEIAEAYFPSWPKIELNARTARPGWDAWGAEAPGGGS